MNLKNAIEEIDKGSGSAADLIHVGKQFYERGWVFGTSGNFSVVLNDSPFELMITESGAHKGMLTQGNFLIISRTREITRGCGKPSAESLLHLAILAESKVGCILHTHSVWATLLTDFYSDSKGLEIQGYEMLKGLSDVKSHEHREWIPIIENSQKYDELSLQISELLREQPSLHGILLRRHGLYTWGKDIREAVRHVEILEFLFEVLGRNPAGGSRVKPDCSPMQ